MPTLYWMKTSEAFPMTVGWRRSPPAAMRINRESDSRWDTYIGNIIKNRMGRNRYVDLKCGGHLLRTKEPAPSFRTGTDQKRSRPSGHGDLGADADILRQDLNGNVRIGYLPAGLICTVEVPLHEEDSDRTKARE